MVLSALAAIACFALLLTRRPRHLLPSVVRGMAEVRRPEVWDLALALGLGLVTGLVSVLLLQTILH
jgi:H+/Cl- antiporter ClcA